MREGETPVPIPNTTVKTFTADGTMRATAWESRWLPDIFIYFNSAHDVFEADRLLADGSDEKNSMRAGREASLTGYIEDF